MDKRLLIVTGEAATTAAEIPYGVRGLIDLAEVILVITPALPGRLDWIASDTDKATEKAEHRLGEVLTQLEPVDAEVHGQVGSDDRLEAFEDAIREFQPDHLLIGLRREDQASWQEKGLVSEIIERFGIPMTVFQLQ